MNHWVGFVVSYSQAGLGFIPHYFINDISSAVIRSHGPIMVLSLLWFSILSSPRHKHPMSSILHSGLNVYCSINLPHSLLSLENHSNHSDHKTSPYVYQASLPIGTREAALLLVTTSFIRFGRHMHFLFTCMVNQ